jgi:hypothetical protein
MSGGAERRQFLIHGRAVVRTAARGFWNIMRRLTRNGLSTVLGQDVVGIFGSRANMVRLVMAGYGTSLTAKFMERNSVS